MTNYTEKVAFTATGRYGNVPDGEKDAYTIEEFKQCVKAGAFIDYDGFGFPAKDHLMSYDIEIRPSKINQIPKDATHIIWFNR